MKVDEKCGKCGVHVTKQNVVYGFGVKTLQNDNIWNIQHRLEENIKKDVKRVEWEVVDFVRLASNKV